jgi:butyryl-CoA dehydrogenase
LFIVPKKLVNLKGELTGVRNDVALAGLNHKCGWRGTTNTLLNFGEGKYPVQTDNAGSDGSGAIGYLGEPGKGLGIHVSHDERSTHWRGLGRHHAGLGRLRSQSGYAKNRPQEPVLAVHKRL